MHHHVRGRLWETRRRPPLGLARVGRVAGAFGHLPPCRPPTGGDPPTAVASFSGTRSGALEHVNDRLGRHLEGGDGLALDEALCQYYISYNCATSVGELIWIRLDRTRLPLPRWRQPPLYMSGPKDRRPGARV